MKEITYKTLEDYLSVGQSYTDPKIIKIYETISSDSLGYRIHLKAVTFMRTWLFQWEIESDTEKESGKIVARLKDAGHMEGRIREVMPTGRYFG